MTKVGPVLLATCLATGLAAGLLVLAGHTPATAAARLAPGLEAAMSAAPEGERFTAWVFLADRGLDAPALDAALVHAEASLDPRTRWRRLLRGSPTGNAVRDLPVSPRYLDTIGSAGATLRATSRWLNAVSISADAHTLRAVAALPFVQSVRPVWTAPAADRLPSSDARAVALPARAAPGGSALLDSLDYGLSFAQLEQIEVPALHRMGLTGAGVRVGMLDTGFRLSHEADAPVHVLAQYDFINRDSITANEPGEDVFYQDTHGTLTLSLLAGYRPGVMIGPAYGADLVLAKTEVLNYERPVEEDWWVEGIEWLESWGVDVVSSSLGYFNFENPYPDYHYPDMDGDTAVTTIAADIAVSLGVVVCNCLGNAGDDAGYTKMIAPSDADSVLGIGAVDAAGQVTPYSSRGPTYDGRIKPDLCARGDVDVCADATSGGYIAETGTSCSTPLAAGVCALLLQARPSWTPMELAARVKATADHAAHPDTLFGWGIMRPAAALAGGQADVAPRTPPDSGALALRLLPNPSRGELRLALAQGPSGDAATAEIRVIDVRGRTVFATTTALPSGAEALRIPLAPGVYLVRATAGRAISQAKALILR